MENICFHRRKLKFCTEETSVFPYRNFCFPRKKPFASLGRNHLLRYSNSDDPGKEYIKNDRY